MDADLRFCSSCVITHYWLKVHHNATTSSFLDVIDAATVCTIYGKVYRLYCVMAKLMSRRWFVPETTRCNPDLLNCRSPSIAKITEKLPCLVLLAKQNIYVHHKMDCMLLSVSLCVYYSHKTYKRSNKTIKPPMYCYIRYFVWIYGAHKCYNSYFTGDDHQLCGSWSPNHILWS